MPGGAATSPSQRPSFELPPLPREPDGVVFNFLEGVLAEVETVEWEGPAPW